MKLNQTTKFVGARKLILRRGALSCGFTLIELLLGVAIFAIVLMAINTVFYSGLRLERATTRALDERVGLNQAMAILRRDLLGAVPPVSNGVFICDFVSGAGRGSSMGTAKG